MIKILIILEDQGGGARMAQSRNSIDTSSTNSRTRASGGFRAENSAEARTVGWQLECAPTVKVGGVGTVLIFYERTDSLSIKSEQRDDNK